MICVMAGAGSRDQSRTPVAGRPRPRFPVRTRPARPARLWPARDLPPPGCPSWPRGTACPESGARPADIVVTACGRQGVEDVPAGYGDDLASGVMDVAPVTPYTAPDKLRARRLFQETRVCIPRAGHPDADRIDFDRSGALSWRSFSGSRWTGMCRIGIWPKVGSRVTVPKPPALRRKSSMSCSTEKLLNVLDKGMVTAPGSSK